MVFIKLIFNKYKVMYLELLAIASIISLIHFSRRWNRGGGLPPGIFGVPLFGYLPNPNVELKYYVDKFIKKYGKTFTWLVGSRVIIFSSDYHLLKSAFNNHLLMDRPRMFSMDVATGFTRLGMINSNGISHKNLRRFTIRHLRDSGVGKSSMEEVINHESKCLIRDLRNYCNEATEFPLSINIAVINVLWGIIAGRRYDVDDQKFHEYQKLITDLIKDFQSVKFYLFSFFPSLDKLVPNAVKGFFGFRKQFLRVEKYSDFLKGIIKEHQEALDEAKPRDYIDSYLIEMKNHDEGKGAETTRTFSELDLLYTLADLFGAGSLTTSSALKWTLLYLIKYPEIQRKIQQNIDEVVPNHRLPDLQDKEKMPLVEATLCEVMRIQTVTPFGPFHCAREATSVHDFQIPKDTIICPAIDACHQDPDYWKDPSDFNPERFLLPDGSVDSKKVGFLPFSIGRRSCPGESLARMQLYLFISALLQKFRFSSPDGVEVDMEPDGKSPSFSKPKSIKIIISERI